MKEISFFNGRRKESRRKESMYVFMPDVSSVCTHAYMHIGRPITWSSKFPRRVQYRKLVVVVMPQQTHLSITMSCASLHVLHHPLLFVVPI